MLEINAVNINIAENYEGRGVYTLSAAISTPNREFLERVRAAISRELSSPEPAPANNSATWTEKD